MKYSKCNFRVEEPFTVMTPIKGFNIKLDNYILFEDGQLVTGVGYTWDGATGAIDSPSIIKASCVHDIFCELINSGRLPPSRQQMADAFLVDKMACYWEWLRVNGTLWQKIKEFTLRPFIKLRQKWIYRAVRIYQEAKRSAPKKKIYEVP